MSTDQPSVPVAQPAANKLQLENQSLKRRLVQYAATLDKLTTHAKREIDQSTRARDEALSRAADASALRQKLSTMTLSLTSAESARDNAAAARARAEARVEQLQATLASLQHRLDDARYDDAHVASMREELASLQKELPNLRRLREQEAARAETLNGQLEAEKQKSASYDSMILRVQQVQTENSQLAADRDASQMALSNIRRSESSLTRERNDIVAKLRGAQDVNDMLRQQMDQLQDRVRLLEQRLKDAEATELRRDKDTANAKRSAEDSVAALRTELDSALKELGDRNTQLEELTEKHDRSIDAECALAERESMRGSITQLQVELDQSTEMLTRAAIDALGDKAKIRKLEDAISKLRNELEAERKEKGAFETKIDHLTQQIAALEGELDQIRTLKRELANECHKYQLQIHERDSVVASKNRALEDLDTDRNDRASQIERLKLELSNAKNALAKKESDLVKITTEHEEMCSMLKSTNRDLDGKHGEVSTIRKELAATNEQISKLTQERDHLKLNVTELRAATRQVEELSTLINSKDEELASMKRWCTTIKAEAGESVREKKRLSDMLSDVSGDLKRANHELELLRNMRQEQEMLALRISQIGETSSRELNDMRKSQSEQAEVLAKSTVEAYQGRLVEMQKSARHEIAETVTSQLRDDIMPHLMRAVDSKARNLVHALAKHVESFTVEDAVSSDHFKNYAPPQPSVKVEVNRAASVEQSAENGVPSTGSRSVSRSGASVPKYADRSVLHQSTTESPSISLANATQGEYTEADTTAEPSAITSDRSIEAAQGYTEPSSVPTATSSARGVPSETAEFHSEDVDVTGDIDPVAIHNRLTETYKELLGGRTDLDFEAFQSVSEVVEHSVTVRQTTAMSVETSTQEGSQQVVGEASKMNEVAVETHETTSAGVDAPPSKSEEELEIVQSYILEEDGIDESLEEGEEETEESQPENEVDEAKKGFGADEAEVFQDALGDVVRPVASTDREVNTTVETNHQEEDEVAEQTTSSMPEEATRELAFEQPQTADKETEGESVAQNETERKPQRTSTAESAPFRAVPTETVDTASADAPEDEEAETAASEPTEDTHDTPLADEPEAGFQDESPGAAEQTEVLDDDAGVRQTDKDFDAPTTEPLGEINADSGVPEAELGFEDETPMPEEAKDLEAQTILGTQDEASEPTEPEEGLTGDGENQEMDSEAHTPVAESVEETHVTPRASGLVVGSEDEPPEMINREEGVEIEGEVEEGVNVPITEPIQGTLVVDDAEAGFQEEPSQPVELEEGPGEDDEGEIHQTDRSFDVPATETVEEEHVSPPVADATLGLQDDTPEPDELAESHNDEEGVQSHEDVDIPATEPVEREVGNTIEAADSEEEHQELIQDDLPQEAEDSDEVFRDAYGDIERTEEDAPVEIGGEIEHQESGDRVIQRTSSGEGKPASEGQIENIEEYDAEDFENVPDAPLHDYDGNNEDPMQVADDDEFSHEIRAPGFGEGGRDAEGVGDVRTVYDHDPAQEQAIEHIPEESYSGLSTDAVEGSTIDKTDDVEGHEQPRALDLSASVVDTSKKTTTTTETERPTVDEEAVESIVDSEVSTKAKEDGAITERAEVQEEASGTIEESVSDFKPLEVSQSAKVDEESTQDSRLDLSSGYEETVLAAEKNVSSNIGAESQEEATLSGKPVTSLSEDEFISPKDETLAIDVPEGVADRGNDADLRDLEDQEPSAEVGDTDVARGAEFEGAENPFEGEEEENIEEVDATREDYGADVDLETEPPVMAFATLNVIEEEDVLGNEEEGEGSGDEYEDAQDEVEDVDVIEGVPADLDDHSYIDDDSENIVNEDDVYGHAVVEELPDDNEGEEADASIAQGDDNDNELQEILETVSTAQNTYTEANETAPNVDQETPVETIAGDKDISEGGKHVSANVEQGASDLPSASESATLTAHEVVEKAEAVENNEGRAMDEFIYQGVESLGQADAPEGKSAPTTTSPPAVESREDSSADDTHRIGLVHDSVEGENILGA
ncbi:unnamed protein product [Agarophyton chilense]